MTRSELRTVGEHRVDGQIFIRVPGSGSRELVAAATAAITSRHAWAETEWSALAGTRIMALA